MSHTDTEQTFQMRDTDGPPPDCFVGRGLGGAGVKAARKIADQFGATTEEEFKRILVEESPQVLLGIDSVGEASMDRIMCVFREPDTPIRLHSPEPSLPDQLGISNRQPRTVREKAFHALEWAVADVLEDLLDRHVGPFRGGYRCDVIGCLGTADTPDNIRHSNGCRVGRLLDAMDDAEVFLTGHKPTIPYPEETSMKTKEMGLCANCGQRLVQAADGRVVHPDEDEDPSDSDYGWVQCCGQFTRAELEGDEHADQ